MATTTDAVIPLSGPPQSGPPASDEVTAVDPDHRTYQRMSLRGPAFIVLGIAVFILIGGVVASALVTGDNPTLALKSITLPSGRSVPVTAAATALKPIISSGEPPADILASLAVPTGSILTGTVNTDRNLAQYDRTASFTTGPSGLSSAQLVAFYQVLLARLGWKVLFTGQATDHNVTGIEVLGKRGSGDGFYWEVGAVVTPAASVAPAGVTPYSLVIYEVPDSD